jgi:hypothetical protein
LTHGFRSRIERPRWAFVLNVLASLKDLTGSYSGGFLAFAVVGGFGGAAALAYASRGWRDILIGRTGVTVDSVVIDHHSAGQAIA